MKQILTGTLKKKQYICKRIIKSINLKPFNELKTKLWRILEM